jgi:hypothetical protein
MLRQAKARTEKRGGGRRAEKDDRGRLHRFDLRFQPRTARVDVGHPRLLVDPPLASCFPAEVFDRVRHVDLVAPKACLLERSIEELPGRTYERRATKVLLIAGLLPDEHHACAGRALSEDGLGCRSPELAGSATGGLTTELVEIAARGVRSRVSPSHVTSGGMSRRGEAARERRRRRSR